MYDPEVDSLLETDLAFVRGVVKENDGVNYLLVVVDVRTFKICMGQIDEKQNCSWSC